MVTEKILKKAVAVGMLSATIAISFTACGEKKQKNTASEKEAEIETVSNKKEVKKGEENLKTETMFQTEYKNFGTDLDFMSDFYYYKERVYMIGERAKKKGRKYYIINCKIDGSDIQEFEIFLEKNEYCSGGLSIEQEGTMRLITKSYNEEKGNLYFVRIFDKEGKEKSKYPLDVKQEDGCYFMQPLITRDGMIYDTGNSKIYCFDTEGKKIKTIETDPSFYIKQLIQTEEGDIYAYCQQDLHGAFRKLDIEAEKLENVITLEDGLSSHVRNLMVGKGSQIYIDSGTSLYCFDFSLGTLETVFNWVNVGIDPNNMRDFIAVNEKSFFTVTYPMGTEDGQHETVIIKKAAENTKERTVLTLACTYMRGDMKENIIKFNRENKDYYVEVQDYADYEDYQSKLNMDIISGKIPDIICLSGLPQDLYVKKEILTDLYPFMEQDNDVKREDFLEPVLKAVEKDGKLFYMGGSFSMEGIFIGGKKNLGEKGGWSIDDMQELYDNMPKQGIFINGMTKEWFIEDIVACKIGDFIDWEKGEAYFDSENFIKILEFSKNFPADEEMLQFYSDAYNEEKMKKILKKGNLMLERYVFSQWSDFNQYDTLFEPAGGMTIRSYPSRDKSDKILMSFYDPGMAITEQCSDKKGAWEFVKTFLSYEYQVGLYNDGFINYGFPTRKDALETQMEYAMKTEEYTDINGRKVTPTFWGTSYSGIQIEGKALKEKHKKMLEEMIDRIGGFIERSNSVTENICNIIKEEEVAFFAGDKTAEETAKIIQNRVKIYISETL